MNYVMTVDELIEKLNEFPKDWKVYYRFSNQFGNLPVGAVWCGFEGDERAVVLQR